MSAQDPKKCCRVLLTWEEEWFKYEKWFKSLAETPPPQQIPVPADDAQRAGDFLKGEHVFRPGADLSRIKEVEVRVDQYATLSNPQNFNGKDTASVSGRRPILYDSEMKYLEGTGACKRLSGRPGGACNCQAPAPTGDVVNGSEKCNNIPEKKVNEQKSTAEVKPRYRFKASISWFRLAGDGTWRPETRRSGDISVTTTSEIKKVPVKREDWWLYKQRCTRRLTREMDCCL
jgi:hypothetical protein